MLKWVAGMVHSDITDSVGHAHPHGGVGVARKIALGHLAASFGHRFIYIIDYQKFPFYFFTHKASLVSNKPQARFIAPLPRLDLFPFCNMKNSAYRVGRRAHHQPWRVDKSDGVATVARYVELMGRIHHSLASFAGYT